jgi:hypothetical protein
MTTSTVKFATFPFTHKGINFVSKIAETSRYLPQIMLMGEAFIEMNKQAVDELINLDENTSLIAIDMVLQVINEGGTEMFLELGAN